MSPVIFAVHVAKLGSRVSFMQCFEEEMDHLGTGEST